MIHLVITLNISKSHVCKVLLRSSLEVCSPVKTSKTFNFLKYNTWMTCYLNIGTKYAESYTERCFTPHSNPLCHYNRSTRITLVTEPFWSLWFFNQYLIELAYRQKTDSPVNLTDEATGIWNVIQPLMVTVPANRESIAR